MKLPNWYNEYKTCIEEALEKHLDTYLAIPMTPPLEHFKEVAMYACQGGKKLRAILALEFYLSLSRKNIDDIEYDHDIMKLCVALECVHAYSLVHDDLPCMDNDELRRGEPTVWKKFSEYEAVLVGDMLNSFCFELISDIKDAKISRDISKCIAHSVGFYGMIGWQVEDLYFENHVDELDIDILKGLHAKKTGKLIEASIISWTLLSWERANADIYQDFGKKLGLAFQVKDDLLDREGTPEETGKSVWGEEKWFVYLIGLDASKKVLHDIILDCKKISQRLGSAKIDFLVDYVENRSK